MTTYWKSRALSLTRDTTSQVENIFHIYCVNTVQLQTSREVTMVTFVPIFAASLDAMLSHYYYTPILLLQLGPRFQ